MIVSSKTRWLSIVTGCLTSVAGIASGLSLGFAFPAGILIIGAIMQPKFRRAGRDLICAGAILLSFFVFGIGFLMLIERHTGSGIMTADVVMWLSVALVALCDASIVMAEHAAGRALTEESA